MINESKTNIRARYILAAWRELVQVGRMKNEKTRFGNRLIDNIIGFRAVDGPGALFFMLFFGFRDVVFWNFRCRPLPLPSQN